MARGDTALAMQGAHLAGSGPWGQEREGRPDASPSSASPGAGRGDPRGDWHSGVWGRELLLAPGCASSAFQQPVYQHVSESHLVTTVRLSVSHL